MVEAALGQIQAVLEKMRSLAAAAAANDLSPAERTAIQEEIDTCIGEIDRIAAAAGLAAKNLPEGPPPGLH